MHTRIGGRYKKTIIISAGLGLFYLLTGFFLAPAILTKLAPKFITQQLNCRVVIEELRINPLALTLEIKQLILRDRENRDLLRFDRLFANVQLSSLARWALTFKQIAIERPQAQIIIASDGQINLAALAAPASTESPTSEKVPLPRVWIDDLAIISGRVNISDHRPGQPAHMNFDTIDATFSHITTLANLDGYGSLHAQTDHGATFDWKGTLRVSPFASSGIVRLDRLSLDTLFAFVQDQFNAKRPGGYLNLELAYRSGIQDHLYLTLSDITSRLTDLNVTLADAEKRFLHLSRVDLKGGKLTWPERRLSIDRLGVENGALHLKQRLDGTVNLVHLIKPSDESTAVSTKDVSAEPSPPITLDIAQFHVSGIEVFAEAPTLSPPAKLRLKELGLNMALSARLDPVTPRTRISNLKMTLHQLSVMVGTTDPNPILLLDKVAFIDGHIDLIQQELSLSKLHLNGGNLTLNRSPQGKIALFDIFSQGSQGPHQPSISPSNSQKGSPQIPWSWSIEGIEVENFNTYWIDKAVNGYLPTATLEGITARMTDLNDWNPFPFELRFGLKQGGYANGSGTIYPDSMAIESDIEVYGVDLKPLDPYMAQLAPITLRSGRLSTQGKLRHGLKAQPAQTIYQGKMMVENLNVTDPAKSNSLLGWKRLKATGLEMTLDPNGIESKDMVLVKPNGRLLISEDGSVNFSDTIQALSSKDSSQGSVSSAKAEKAPFFPVNVDRLRLTDGELDFADMSLNPTFSTKIHQLQGSVTGISLSPDMRAKIELEGQVDKYGVSKIEGELSPAAPKNFADIGMHFKNVEMARFSPYTGKFAGRKIDSGKLSLDLKYNIEESRLLGSNQIVVEKLMLGQKVPNPDAPNLPLDLAVALLEDENGVIDLGLPVQGNLDDPKFNYGHLVWETLRKQIYKVASSPFRALSSLFNDEYSGTGTILFKPGQATLTPPEREKLIELRTALKARPQLSLTIIGRFHPETDGLYFKDLKLRTFVTRLLELELEAGEDPGPLNFRNPDVQEIISDLYKEQFGRKAFKILQTDHESEQSIKADRDFSQTEEELELLAAARLAKICFERLRDAQSLASGALNELAAERSQTILSNLTGADGITIQRLNIAPPEALSADDPISAALTLAVVTQHTLTND